MFTLYAQWKWTWKTGRVSDGDQLRGLGILARAIYLSLLESEISLVNKRKSWVTVSHMVWWMIVQFYKHRFTDSWAYRLIRWMMSYSLSLRNCRQHYTIILFLHSVPSDAPVPRHTQGGRRPSSYSPFITEMNNLSHSIYLVPVPRYRYIGPIHTWMKRH